MRGEDAYDGIRGSSYQRRSSLRKEREEEGEKREGRESPRRRNQTGSEEVNEFWRESSSLLRRQIN